MSNRLWAEHVKKPGLWKRLPLIVKILIIASLLVGGAYGAVLVTLTLPGHITTVTPGLVWVPPVPVLEITGVAIPLSGSAPATYPLNMPWTLKNTGTVKFSLNYSTDLPAGFKLVLVGPAAGGVDIQGFGLEPGLSTSGDMQLVVSSNAQPANNLGFTLTVKGCYPVGLC